MTLRFFLIMTKVGSVAYLVKFAFYRQDIQHFPSYQKLCTEYIANTYATQHCKKTSNAYNIADF